MLIETLESRKGSLTGAQLLKLLKKLNGDLNNRMLNKALLRLELEGLIHVFTLTKNRRRIELVPPTKKR